MNVVAATSATSLQQRLAAKLDQPARARDQDGDGRISPAERAASRQNVPGSGANGPTSFATALQQADSNGDGSVSQQERDAAGTRPAAPRPALPGGGARTL